MTARVSLLSEFVQDKFMELFIACDNNGGWDSGSQGQGPTVGSQSYETHSPILLPHHTRYYRLARFSR